VFRRRRRDEPDDVATTDDGDDAGAQPADGDAAAPPATAGGRPTGPWDSADVPDDDRPRLDLGAIQLPVPEGMEVRLDVQDNVVVAATVVSGNSALQVHAFAAPRSAGIWPDVRDEIAASLRESGGSADITDGSFGSELRARIPADAPGQGPMLQPARFVGVDGPRWFLRGMFTGAAATDSAQAGALETVFRDTIVVRGGDAMAPRELLPLRLPKEAVEQPPPSPPARPTLEHLARGPEITETR
jgi:hypothetical protein